MPENANPAHIWELMEKITFCMLATRDGEDIHSRPMAAYVRPDEGSVYFLTDAGSAKADELQAHPQVNLGFADSKGQTYVSVSGRASVSNDRQKIRDLFGTAAKAWWDDPEDPSIRVLKVAPTDAYYWDSPGTIRSYIKMAAAAVTDSRPAMGEHGRVDMQTERA